MCEVSVKIRIMSICGYSEHTFDGVSSLTRSWSSVDIDESSFWTLCVFWTRAFQGGWLGRWRLPVQLYITYVSIDSMYRAGVMVLPTIPYLLTFQRKKNEDEKNISGGEETFYN